ncbi:hypothetical protein PR048_027776 [Dryococelus australis]|uniref:DUF5641 domain-containing protein n=1 Tax=Dryococelus australis TaxID=614101 RepID=A0ABQ9GHG9_9NEOP|nr:hypothetical protein PR048_027776 [Dryococelus australis]
MIPDCERQQLRYYQQTNVLDGNMYNCRSTSRYVGPESTLTVYNKDRDGVNRFRTYNEVNNLPPLQRNLARIVGLHSGADGLMRVATIRTSADATDDQF